MNKKIWTILPEPAALNLRYKNSLSDHLGIEFVEVGSDFLTARMPVDQRTIQPAGIMHGGASAALAETVGSVAGNYCVDPSLHICVGIDLNINHLRPVSGGMVEAVAKPLHLGKKTQVWEIKIFDEKGKLTSAARLTLMAISKGPSE